MDPNFYVNLAQVRKLGFSRDKASELLHKVRKDLEAQGVFLPNGLKAPRWAVMKVIGGAENA